MKLKEALKQVYEEVETTYQQTLQNVDFSAFNDCNSVLIIQSASIGLLREFVSRFKSVNPKAMKYIITHSSNIKEVESIGECNIEVIEYCYNGNYEINNFSYLFKRLENLRFDKVVVLYNNRFGMGYENVEQIIKQLEKDCYAFNSYLELYRFNNFILRQESYKLLVQINNWFWEYLRLTKGRE